MVLNLKGLPGAPDAPEHVVQRISLLSSAWFVLRVASQCLRVFSKLSPGLYMFRKC